MIPSLNQDRRHRKEFREGGFACGKADGLGLSILMAAGLFDAEVPKAIAIASSLSRIAEPGELERIDFNLFDNHSLILVVQSLIRMELEPFIISVG